LIRSGARGDLTLALAALVPLILFSFQEWRIAGEPGFPLDDSWIHLHFARNLAEGAGFAYNPGRPVAGSTAPLWTLLIAAGVAIGGSPIWVAKALGVATTLASALLARRLALALSGEANLGLLAGLGTLFIGRMAWGSLSGMEVGLAAMLVTGALLAHVREQEWIAALLSGLAVLARPEAFLLVPLLLMARPLAPARAVRLLGVVALLVAPSVAFSLATAGTPVPATAAAKVEGGLLGFLTGAREGWQDALVHRPTEFMGEWVSLLWDEHPLLPFTIPIGFVVLWRERGRSLIWPAALLLLHPLGMALLAPYRGPAFQEGRYSAHLAPLAVVVAMVGLAWAAGRGRRLRRWTPAVYLLLAVVWLWPASLRYAGAVREINAMQVHLGQWVESNLPKDARLALNDVGAIAYFSRREVVDLIGLVTPEVIPYRKAGEAGVVRFLDGQCPDYLIIFPSWFPALSAMTDRFAPVYQVKLDEARVVGGNPMVVYETAWNRSSPSPRPCPSSAGGVS
jgi:hypothetical protein